MPLTVNVGLSRKSSENYQSQGLSINITAELDQSLLADPPRLQDEIDRIYTQAEDALARQSSAGRQNNRHAPRGPAASGNGRTHTNGSAAHGHASSNGRAARPPVHQGSAQGGGGDNGAHHGGLKRPATESQMRALHSLAKRVGRPLEDILIETFGEATVYTDIRMASRLIDLLKEQLGEGQAANGQSRSRA